MRISGILATSYFLLSCYGLVAPKYVASDSATFKPVLAHFMVGNTYPYSENDWARDILLANSKGIDGFVLNVGNDYWQRGRVNDAYSAAQSSGTNFKLCLSFDMTSLPCRTSDDAASLKQYISDYSTHAHQLFYNNKILVSTFSGEHCLFGMGNLNDAWSSVVRSGAPVWFAPAFFVDLSTFSSLTVMDGALNWNSGWPMGDSDINFDRDNEYISHLGGRPYVAAVSPWFFTHYGPNTYNKNFIYRSDDWLISERWESLIQNRNSVGLVEIISWNDYGESHYVGPIEGAQPMSEAWTNGFDHTAWLDLMQYYIQAFKTGRYPSINKDKIWVWSRLYPANANVPSDSVGRPNNWSFTEDSLWAVVFLTAPADVTLSCGVSYSTQRFPAGVSKLKLALSKDCQVRAIICKDGVNVVDFQPPGFKFSTNPPSYNFNAMVAMASSA